VAAPDTAPGRTRNIRIALPRLRKLARIGAAREPDLDGARRLEPID
jgi:uncharacterized protein with von Willebrand factor type A (vWA) domain